jgi:uncharacterized membrane protein YkvA (DUF1232 family)
MTEGTKDKEHEMEDSPSLVADRRDAGFWREFWRQVRLVWYLFRDPEVPAYLKLLPVAAVLYALMPFDLIPDMIVGLGQLDDLTILLLGGKVFIEMSPPEVVARYLKAMRRAAVAEDLLEEAGETAQDTEVSDAITLNPDSYQVDKTEESNDRQIT